MDETSKAALVSRDPLARWGRAAVRRRWLVLASWVLALMAVVILWRSFGGEFAASFDVPGTESQQAFDLLKARFPQQAGDSAVLVFETEGGVSAASNRQRIEALLGQTRKLPGVVEVGSPYEPGRGAVSQDGRIGYATVFYGERAISVPRSDVEALLTLADRAKG